jgi:hypothetical protein
MKYIFLTILVIAITFGFLLSQNLQIQFSNSFEQAIQKITGRNASATSPGGASTATATTPVSYQPPSLPTPPTPISPSSSQPQGGVPTGFHGPSGPPQIQGPTGPPPNY